MKKQMKNLFELMYIQFQMKQLNLKMKMKMKKEKNYQKILRNGFQRMISKKINNILRKLMMLKIYFQNSHMTNQYIIISIVVFKIICLKK